MAITGAVTLAHIAQVEKNDITRGILMDLLRNSDLAKVVPFVTKKRLNIQGQRVNTLPDIAFRALNEGYTPSIGDTIPFQDNMSFLGGSLKIDTQMDDLDPESVIEDPRVMQLKLKNTALAFTFSRYFIWGDKAVSMKQFNGVNKMVSNMPSAQTVSLSAAFDVTATVANSRKLIDKLHEMDDLVGGADAWLMNRLLKLGIGRALRNSSLLDTTTDAFGRKFMTLLNGKVIDVGLQKDQATEVIGNAYGAGSNETLLYAVKWGTTDGLCGIQKNLPKPKDKGEDPDSPTRIFEIDWGLMLWANSRFCISKLTGILDPSLWT